MFATVVDKIAHPSLPWLSLFAIAASVLFGVLAVFFWAQVFKKKRKRKRKHHGHGRINPTPKSAACRRSGGRGSGSPTTLGLLTRS
jgi:hypothetical protein